VDYINTESKKAARTIRVENTLQIVLPNEIASKIRNEKTKLMTRKLRNEEFYKDRAYEKIDH
jgi:hypothetical protein